MILAFAPDHETFARSVAGAIADQLRRKPDTAMILATGNTPMDVYRELAAQYAQGTFDTSKACVFQLDEYVGIEPEDDRSLYGWLKRAVLDPLEIPDGRVVRLRGDALDLDHECRNFDAAVERVGGLDFAILGLGPNGHIGFNEPPSSPGDPTRVVRLTQASIQSNGEYWGGAERVPQWAITAGMKQLLAARVTYLLATGAHKASIVRRAVQGSPSPEVPASYLQGADTVFVVMDIAAAGSLSPSDCRNQ